MQPNKPQVALMGAIIATIQVILIVSVVRDLQTSGDRFSRRDAV